MMTDEPARNHSGGGLVVDYFFGENYAFNTGLELVSKGRQREKRGRDDRRPRPARHYHHHP